MYSTVPVLVISNISCHPTLFKKKILRPVQGERQFIRASTPILSFIRPKTVHRWNLKKKILFAKLAFYDP
jgi:hypothetical protein